MDYWNGFFYSKAADGLLDLKNCEWNNTGEEISNDEFVARINLSTILVRKDGSYEIWFEDGGMFDGHAILLQGFLDGGISDVSLQG